MNIMQQKFSGFTIIEVIMSIAIMAFLVSAASITYVSVRKQTRDAARLTHITQIQSALAAYHRDNGVYPAEITPGLSFVGGNVTYMSAIPTNPLPIDFPCPAIEYDYLSDNSGISYHITFCLSSRVSDLNIGPHVATPVDIGN